MRKSIEQIGLLLVLIIASVSLPTAIISLNQPPIVNTYNNTYNTYYNQTLISTNETDYSTPMEMTTYYNLEQYDLVIRKYNLSTEYVYWYYWNASALSAWTQWVCQSIFYEDIVALNGTNSEFVTFIDDVKVHEYSETNNKRSTYYIPPFEDEWLFIFQDRESFSVNFTIRDQIIPI